MMNRECNKCIHHTSGMCDSWDCKMQTVEGLVKETRAKAIEEFAERFEKICDKPLCDRCNDFSDCLYCLREGIKEIAKEMKGE